MNPAKMPAAAKKNKPKILPNSKNLTKITILCKYIVLTLHGRFIYN